MRWALFDLDNTILDHDSFRRFTTHLLRRNPVRAVGAALLSPLVAVLFARPRWRIHAGSILLWLGTVGMREARLDRITRDYLRRLDVAQRVRPGGAEAMAKHFHVGDNVAVVTACAEQLAIPLCRAIDPRIQVIASTLSWCWGGMVADRHCHGDRKVEMIAESAVDGAVVAGYGDSVSDIPMLNLARAAVLVNLPESLTEEVRRQLDGPDSVELVHWPPRENATGEERP